MSVNPPETPSTSRMASVGGRHGLAWGLLATGVIGVLQPLDGVPGWALRGLGLLALALAAWQVHRQREQRETGLLRQARSLSMELALSADLHFELDADGRLRRYQHAAGVQGLLEPGDRGRLPWDWPGMTIASTDLVRLQAALAQSLPLRDLPLSRIDGAARERHLRLSLGAMPDGRFGGVLREVSSEVETLRALHLSQARYQELVRRLPLPLVLHREGVVIDANPAAVALLGHGELATLLGSNFIQRCMDEDSRVQALAKLQQLVQLAPGRHLPPDEYRLQPQPDRLLTVMASSAQVKAEDGQAAVLTIFTDVTEHRQAEQALQRSEALLSHLVANSPDLITLTELATGRYLMVNPSFTRVAGWTAEEAVGHTSTELGIWVNEADRARFLQQLARDGTVRNLSLPFRVRDGRTVAMLVSAARFTLDEADYLILSCRDVTASEQARLEREAILENAQMGIALTRDYHFLMANPRLEQMLGWPVGSLAGRHVGLVWADQAEFEQLANTLVPRLNAGEQVELERPMLRRDGSSFIARVLAKAVDPGQPQRGTIWFAEDITQRRQTERALARARDDAEAASRAKSAFLASTSHEIRTPLNALLGLARLARNPSIDETRRRQYIDQISDSAETLSGILSDILDLSKIEAGKMHLDLVTFDLGLLLTSLHQAYGALADTKGLGFQVQRDEDLPEAVLGDSVRVRQILSNFLNNALKFTERGEIRLAARVVRTGLLRFEVTDTGPGIAAELQARLFRPFVQGDEAMSRAFGGTGLGLSISRELAEMMGGRVGVVSVPGQGSCFWAELPLASADPADVDSGSTNGDADPIQGARLLMVEDNPVNMMIAVALLEQWGAEVSQAGDGEEAMAAVDEAVARGHPFDLVLMDVQMPGIGGHEAARRLRERYDARTLPIVALTAAALVSERDEALAAGMNDFLTKPIDASRLRHTLNRWLRQASSDSPE
ncbi:PAS domain S-box protein [Ideonella sp. 4Y16]|uniref:PAS domain S-box protein n=1 Tax=Ideonella alba TaxID=2824118 RepID=UPI001B375CBE|nr:PAS domain S-box protein [Ideonella alba]MBQ0942933.1 PAS domain S-box protein [Ideonella alba]